jgi:hypothetical protein
MEHPQQRLVRMELDRRTQADHLLLRADAHGVEVVIPCTSTVELAAADPEVFGPLASERTTRLAVPLPSSADSYAISVLRFMRHGTVTCGYYMVRK